MVIVAVANGVIEVSECIHWTLSQFKIACSVINIWLIAIGMLE
jgi:hypothetical protein